MSEPSVAVIIPTRNRTEFLKRCLSKLVPYIATVIQGLRRGIPANRNYGAAHSTGELIIFLDDDCVPEPNLIATYQEAALRKPEVGVFEGRISLLGKMSSFADVVPANETGGYLWSCNFAVRRTIFEKISGFDERLRFATEDVDFHLRVKRQTPVHFLAEARVWHEPARRVGWHIVQHQALCDILYYHIRGLKATNRNSVFYLRMAAQYLIFKVWRHLRAGAIKDPMQLILQCVGLLELSFIVFAWRFHVALARILFPPCCPGCELIYADLAAPAFPSNSLEDGQAPADYGGRHAG